MSESIIFLVLALVWVGYLTIWWRDSRKVSSRRTDRISTFSRDLGSLGGSGSRSGGASSLGSVTAGAASLGANLAPRSVAAAAQRRREVLAGLGVFAVITLLGALAFGAVFLLLHLIVDIALAAFAYACVQRRNDAAEREMKVTMLYPSSASAAPVSHAPAPLRRTANG